MKRLFMASLFFMIGSSGFALTVNDIPVISSVTSSLQQKVSQLVSFSSQLNQLQAANFQSSIAGSSQTLTLTQQNKQDLLIYYLDLRQKIQDAANSLP